MGLASRPAWTTVPKIVPASHCERSLRSNLPVNERDCFVAHYAPRNDIFIRCGVAPGMNNWPENRRPPRARHPLRRWRLVVFVRRDDVRGVADQLAPLLGKSLP
jgi:hypothetical protein